MELKVLLSARNFFFENVAQGAEIQERAPRTHMGRQPTQIGNKPAHMGRKPAKVGREPTHVEEAYPGFQPSAAR